MVHELKTDSPVFRAVFAGHKTYEIRYNDRDYHRWDILILKETESTRDEMKEGKPLVYTGNVVEVVVTHVLRGPIYGLEERWVILSIRILKKILRECDNAACLS